MFIIIDCYLVLHHKYEINVMLYVTLCYVRTVLELDGRQVQLLQF